MGSFPACAWLATLLALAGEPGVDQLKRPAALRLALTCRELADLLAESSGLSGGDPGRLLNSFAPAQSAARRVTGAPESQGAARSPG